MGQWRPHLIPYPQVHANDAMSLHPPVHPQECEIKRARAV